MNSMIPITQTKVLVTNSKGEQIVIGNCYAAVIASILELPITEVPNVEVFYHLDNGYYNEVMCTFLDSLGWELTNDERYRCFHNNIFGFDEWSGEEGKLLRSLLKDKYYLVTGKSPRGVSHICIYKNGTLVHDPHPTREGLVSLDYFQTLERLTPPAPEGERGEKSKKYNKYDKR